MKLDLKERYMISNQLKILEALYPDDADSYANDRKAIENGYSLNYDWITEYFSKEMSTEDCKEVLSILDMYRAITDFSAGSSPLDEGDHDSYWVKFKGFDGNNEGGQYSYARYVIMDLDRYQELRYGQMHPDLNSHGASLEKYRRMLEKWKSLGKEFRLTKDQLIAILKA